MATGSYCPVLRNFPKRYQNSFRSPGNNKSFLTRKSNDSHIASQIEYSLRDKGTCLSRQRDTKYPISYGIVFLHFRPLMGRTLSGIISYPRKESARSLGKSTPEYSAKCIDPQNRRFISIKKTGLLRDSNDTRPLQHPPSL
jgi:hypothetical protein